MTEKSYEDLVLECAETRRDLDVVHHPMMTALKKAFRAAFEADGFGGSDFKRLSDLVYYKGGYPSPESPPKTDALADDFARSIKLCSVIGHEAIVRRLRDVHGIDVVLRSDPIKLGPVSVDHDEADDFEDNLATAGISKSEIPADKLTLLKLMVDAAQALQAEICQLADTIKVDGAEEAENKYEIKKSNFVRAVGLMATKLRRGEGPMAEKIDKIEDDHINLERAIEPMLKKAGK